MYNKGLKLKPTKGGEGSQRAMNVGKDLNQVAKSMSEKKEEET
jgi:hypothetical protein